MASRAPERGGLERHLVARAEVLETDATGVLARTVAYRHPWPQGPFPPPPAASVKVEVAADRVAVSTPAMTAVATLAPYGLEVRGAAETAPGGRRQIYLPAGAWTDWWTRERVGGPSWVPAEHGLDTMPLYLREGAVVPMGPVVQRVWGRPADPLTVVVAPFGQDGRTELHVPTGGREATIRYQARDGRHQVEVAGHPGELVLDAPPGVELRR